MKHYLTDLRSKLATAEKCPSMMRGGIGQIPHRKKDNKGFTLVELIVVIVILAILAAILVPALVGWIDKAKEEQNAIEARSAYLATQAVVSEQYGKTGSTDFTKGTEVTDTDKLKLVKDLSGVNVTSITVTSYVKELTDANATAGEKYTIKEMSVTFIPAKGGTAVTMTLEDGEWK